MWLNSLTTVDKNEQNRGLCFKTCVILQQVIENRMDEVCTMWDTLKERTNSRLEALDRAREIHAFNRNVEETRAWIQEKEAALMFSDDGARDLSSVQALQRKHQGFQVWKCSSIYILLIKHHSCDERLTVESTRKNRKLKREMIGRRKMKFV